MLVQSFESQLAKTLNRPVHVVSTNSGTSAIHLALLALGVGPGDMVIAPTFTYIGSVAPIQYIGAKPVFIDCEPDTWGMDPELLRQCLAEMADQRRLPKAVIAVDCYGMPAKWNEINDVCRHYGVPTIEDAAAALGGSYHGEPCGTLSGVGVFSFNSNKTVTTFGGGAIVARSAAIAERARFLAAFARHAKPYYHYSEVGFNYRMGPLNAAYGISQLPLAAQKIAARRQQFEVYRSALSPLGIRFLTEQKGFLASRWVSTITFEKKINIIDFQLLENEIEMRPLWKPMHLQPVFKGAPAFVNGVSERLFNAGLCLPSGTAMTDAEVHLVATKVAQVVG